MIAFLDTSALIYLLEGESELQEKVRQRLLQLNGLEAGLKLALSRLTWLEARVGPMKHKNLDLLKSYDAFFERPDLHWIELSQNVVELATVIRVRHGLRTPDALQAASCLQLRDEHLFFTGDAEFLKVAGLHVEHLVS